MSFTDAQLEQLKAPLDARVVKPPAPGKYGDYIEGWWAISEANRIFGFDMWDRETELCQLGEPTSQDNKWRVNYRARVTITVRGGHGGVVIKRQGCGFGQGIDRDVGQAHESALKEAETDAMKRALMTFGNPFGLALYDKTKANVGDPHSEARLKELEEGMIAAEDTGTLDQLVTVEYAGDLEVLFQSDKSEWQRLSALFRRRRGELSEPKPEPETQKKGKAK